MRPEMDSLFWGNFDGRLQPVTFNDDVLFLELLLKWNLVPAYYEGNWN